MVAPEKIYILKHSDYSDRRILNAFTEKEDSEDIEYTHTDAFIEKAVESFCKAVCNGHPPRSACTSLGTCKEYDKFVKFMKGE